MVLQGVWMGNFIQKYSPHMRWGAAPFPSEKAGAPPITIADADMLVIPNGAQHPKEAFEFIQYLAQQGPMEKACLGQRKISPLRKVSPEFFRRPQESRTSGCSRTWLRAAGATAQPKMSIWNEYTREIRNASQRLWLGEATPERALGDVQLAIQKSWNRERERQDAPTFALVLRPTFRPDRAARRGDRRRSAARAGKARRAMTGVKRPVRSNASLWKGLGFFSPWGIGLLAVSRLSGDVVGRLQLLRLLGAVAAELDRPRKTSPNCWTTRCSGSRSKTR